jgi:hypothetical protein
VLIIALPVMGIMYMDMNNATAAAMEEVKKTLIKKGLIKVGSTAPTDVLRKMYESVSLVCGDIQNHNPDNLLYNYMNGGDA